MSGTIGAFAGREIPAQSSSGGPCEVEYEYDVFLSYRRSGEWPVWVERRFYPLFRHWLSEELAPTGLLGDGEGARIACDFQTLEGPLNWPIELARQLARSRTVVALWSRQYFNSIWCRTELALICARESECGFNCEDRPDRLVIPAIIDDGDFFPHHFRGATAVQLRDCANVRTVEGSPRLELLSDLIRDWVPQVRKAVLYAPPCQDGWRRLAIERFLESFRAPPPWQRELPSLATR